MDEEKISLAAPPSPTFTFKGYGTLAPATASRITATTSRATASSKYPHPQISPVKRQRQFSARNPLKRKHHPDETGHVAAPGDMSNSDARIGSPAAFEDNLTNLDDLSNQLLDALGPGELGSNSDCEYEDYVEAALADVAGFIQLRETLFVVQGWDKRAGNALVRREKNNYAVISDLL